MQNSQVHSSPTLDGIRQDLYQAVTRLERMVRRDSNVLAEMDRVRDFLESLPLTSGEFTTPVNRLQNAHRYLVSNERGAARYELRMLAASLRCDDARNVGPRIRARRSAG